MCIATTGASGLAASHLRHSKKDGILVDVENMWRAWRGGLRGGPRGLLPTAIRPGPGENSTRDRHCGAEQMIE